MTEPLDINTATPRVITDKVNEIITRLDQLEARLENWKENIERGISKSGRYIDLDD